MRNPEQPQHQSQRLTPKPRKPQLVIGLEEVALTLAEKADATAQIAREGHLGGGDEDAFLGEAVSNTSDEVDSLPPATSFPINFGFSETSLKTEGKREANSRPVFGY